MSALQSQSPHGPKPLCGQDADCSPRTPRLLPRCGEMMPPALPHAGISLKSALSSGCVQTVNKLLLCDDTLVHVPLPTISGCELPIIAAIRMGCCATVVEVLLRHGAAPTVHGRCGASALHIIVLSLHNGKSQAGWPFGPNVVEKPHLLGFADSMHDMPLTPCFAHQFEWGATATCPQIQMCWRNAEQHICDMATCLLQYGADTAEKWKGLLPAEAARQSGQEHLANIIEHFIWWRAQQILAKHMSAATRAKRLVSPLLQCKANVYRLISEFVAPPLGGSTVQSRSKV